AVDQGLVERINRKAERTESRDQWLARQQAECIDQEQWLQEYCCVPADEASAFISYDLITSCEEPGLRLLSIDELLAYASGKDLPDFGTTQEENTPPERSASKSPVVPSPRRRPLVLYIGVDVARKHDLCVIDVGEQIGDVVWDRLRLELHNKT